MAVLFFGIALIVVTQAIVMGVPFMYYLRRDQEMEARRQLKRN